MEEEKLLLFIGNLKKFHCRKHLHTKTVYSLLKENLKLMKISSTFNSYKNFYFSR